MNSKVGAQPEHTKPVESVQCAPDSRSVTLLLAAHLLRWVSNHEHD
jgi:hypothetical protein